MESMYIGKVKIERTAALAPMASVADRAYRLMCKKFGAAYCVSEMISSKGLAYGDKKSASKILGIPLPSLYQKIHKIKKKLKKKTSE